MVPCLLGTFGCGGATSASPAGDAGAPSEAGQASGDGGRLCSGDAECGPEQICAYLESAGCTAHGQCVPRSNSTMCILTRSCDCDGGTIDYNVACSPGMSGYVSTPILHMGACASDGG